MTTDLQKSLQVLAAIICMLLPFQTVIAAPECNSPGSCTSEEQMHPFDEAPFVIPDEFQEAWKNYRTGWARITGFELSGLHWKQFVIVYLNKGRDIYKKNYAEYVRFYVEEDDDEDAAFEEFETGTVFIKENFLAQDGKVGQPLSLTVMIKREAGYDSDHNDWEYLQASVSGKILLRGSYSDEQTRGVCAECHGNIAERDFIFSTFYSE